MKSFLRRISFETDLLALTFMIWLYSVLRKESNTPKPSLCFVLEGEGNLGSRALVETVISNLPSNTIFVASENKPILQLSNPGNEPLIIPHLYPNFRPTHFKALSKLASKIQSASHTFVIGADNMDGAYSNSLSALLWNVAIASTSNRISASILGFSWNKKPTDFANKRLIRAAKKGVILNVRDIYSFQRAKELCSADNIRQTSDIVFSLGNQNIESKITSSKKAANKQVLFVGNPGFTLADDDFSPNILRNIFEAIGRDLKIIFVPSVIRPGQNDLIQQSRIFEAFHSDFEIELLRDIPSTRQYIDLASESLLVVTFRMHPAILSLMAEVPVVMFDYQDKMRGLAADFGLLSLCVSTGDWISDGAKAISQCMEAQIEIREAIRKALQHQKIRASLNWHTEVVGGAG